ncbi:hypothetical protein H2201_007814 [Coniosporium apollinis]|uniref:RNA polymerase I-specific transcription initiation factor RRN6-like protein n=1 Tax=Coniosporium apollinis TaxID=61459 RepID=A0ABQ9NKN2_9PEZI|nr:hypothetical protein H2201_007814 [Coniosporium apollinis]
MAVQPAAWEAQSSEPIGKSQDIPELGLGCDNELLSNAAITSGAVTSAVEHYDPLKGDIIAYGKAADIDNGRGKGKIQIAAVAGGAAGEALRLIQVRRKRQGWDQDYSIALEVPDLESGDTGWWAGGSAAIQQVCFSHSNDDKSNFLAVRTLRATHIFRPQYYRDLVPPTARHGTHVHCPASRVYANPILSLPVHATGVSHADVGFNPWYQQQFAIVDRDGKWSVYDIEGSRRTSSYKAVPFRSGALLSDLKLQGGDSSGAAREDGWMRVLFTDVNHVTVCSRRQFGIFDLRGESVRLKSPGFSMERSPGWFLDVRRDPVNDGHVVVLTSTHLFLVCLDGVSMGNDSSQSTSKARIVLSWRHFRDAEDITMQLSVFADDEDTLLPLGFTPEQSPPRTLLNLSLRSLDYREDLHAHLRRSGPGHGYRDDEIQFYCLILLYSDLSVSECFLYAQSGKDAVNAQSRHLHPVEAPSWTRQYQMKSTTKVSDDDFIVHDSAEADLDRRKAPRYSRLFPKRLSRPKLGSEEWLQWITVDEGSCDLVEEQLQRGEEKVQETFDSVLDTIRTRMIVADEEPEPPRGTLLEVAGVSPRTGEVDTASEALEKVKNTFATSRLPEESGRIITQLASPEMMGLDVSFSRSLDTDLQQPSEDDGRVRLALSNVYGRMLEQWLSPLPSNVPARHRFESARTAKDIAAELCLASARADLYEHPPAAEPDSLPQESETASQLGGPSSFPRLATALPTPEATPSLRSASFSTSTLSSLQDPSQAYLGQYMHIAQPLPLPTGVSSRLQAHWTLSADPNTYDYTATNIALQDAAESEGEGLSAKQRARLKRRAEKHLQRQRRETARAASSSQPIPSLRTMSSPGPPALGPGVGSSQMVSSQMPMASQVVPGAFGGRPAKRKKARQAGF